MNKINPVFEALSGVDERYVPVEQAKRPAKKIKFALITAAAAAAALCIGVTAGANMASGFVMSEGYSKDLKQPTLTFSAANSQNCPETIERFYLPSTLPEGVEFSHYSSSVNANKTAFSAMYFDLNTDENLERSTGLARIVTFMQWTKAEFKRTYRVPGYVEVSDTTVNGCPAHLLVEEHYYGTDVSIVWDNGDYIMEVGCFYPVDVAMKIAESVRECSESEALERID